MKCLDKVKLHIREVAGSPEEINITGDTRLKDDLALDSLLVISIIAKYMSKKKLKASKIDPDWLEDLDTASKLADIFRKIDKIGV